MTEDRKMTNELAPIEDGGTSAPPVETDARLEALAQEIELCEGLVESAALRMGECLKEAKAIHLYKRSEGGWAGWVKQRLSFSVSKADSLIRIHEQFHTKVGHRLPTLGWKALKELAADNTPNEVVEEVEDRLEKGETVTVKEIEELKAKLTKTDAKRKEDKEKREQVETHNRNLSNQMAKLRAELEQMRLEVLSVKNHNEFYKGKLQELEAKEGDIIDVTPTEIVEEPQQGEHAPESESKVEPQAEVDPKFKKGLKLFDKALDIYSKDVWADFADACFNYQLDRRVKGRFKEFENENTEPEEKPKRKQRNTTEEHKAQERERVRAYREKQKAQQAANTSQPTD
jgi:hypothetical protein